MWVDFSAAILPYSLRKISRRQISESKGICFKIFTVIAKVIPCLLSMGNLMSSSLWYWNCCMPLFLTQVTRSVSMPTTLPSAGLPGIPSRSRTWFLLAASEPASERRCSSVLRSLMVRWSTPPCSGPACSDLQRPMGCGCVCGKNLSRWSQVHLCMGG